MQKEDQQNAMNSNAIEVSHDYYDELKPNHKSAVDWRILGVSYKDIADKLKVEVQSVRRWFMKNGICYEAYKQESRLRAKDRKSRFKELDKRIEQVATDAIVVVHDLIKNPAVDERVRGNLAVELLKMSGKGVISKVQLANDPENPVQGTIIVLPDNHRDAK